MNGNRNDSLPVILWTGVTAVVVLLAFFLLNYFNVLSLSELFPSAFGWLTHRQTAQRVATPQTESRPTPGAVKTSLLFKSQTAVIEGQVVEVDGGKITVSANGQAETFAVASAGLKIYKYDAEGNISKFTGPQDVELNRTALINLEGQEGEYRVVSVTYVAPAARSSQ